MITTVIDEAAGLTFFVERQLVVDGIESAHPELFGDAGPGYVRSIVSLAEDHECTRVGDCDFDMDVDVDERIDTELPTSEAITAYFRWRPGDPVYRPGPAGEVRPS